jgi:hypothetical protein
LAANGANILHGGKQKRTTALAPMLPKRNCFQASPRKRKKKGEGRDPELSKSKIGTC